MKSATEGIFRLVVDLLRGTHLLDVTLVHDNNGVGHSQASSWSWVT